MNVKNILKQIFSMCKSDVYFTMMFCTLLYLAVYITLLLFSIVDIFSYSDNYYPSFLIGKWLIFISSFLTAFKIFKENPKLNSLFIFIFIAILFNPFFFIPFSDGQWFCSLIVSFFVYVHFCIIFYFATKNSIKCSICNSKPLFSKVNKVHIYKGGFGKGEVHFDSDIFICKKCYDECEICKDCGHIIMTKKIKEVLGEWESIHFCTCKNR